MLIIFGLLPLLLRLVINSRGVQSQSVTCQHGWTGYGNHCYWSVPGLKKSWEDAQNDCRSQDSNLVKTETADEYSWLTGFVTLSDYPWIGAYDRNKKGDWRWISDNSTLTFSNWGPSEPNGPGTENCVHMYVAAIWNDNACTDLQGFICEKEGKI
ncbi:perlucin-like protein [Mizuhopecten yessoensis]|uniref:perlucin-like protein n=1 Tax=Mizuhopecten yessoensis TaxID=6573 RepID=UPI000B459B6C|nr:perlucin-like protein [Mizuhopecten yessoensis]